MTEKQKFAKSKTEGIVPQLRFPEFKDNWKTARLKDVSSYFNGKSFEGDVQENGKYELVTLKSIDTDGNLVHSNRYINDDVKTLAKGTLVMILSEQAPGLLGMTAIIPDNNKYVLNQRVAEIRPTDKVVNYFLSMAINRNQSYFSRLGAGMKVQNISKGNVENYELSYPSIAEQKKIANCFSSLDVIINSETEKLTLYQDHKKGLLQQLFPAEGDVTLSGAEGQPKFRFPEFKKDGEWEYFNGNKLFEPISNKNHNSDLPILAITQEKGAIPREEIDYHVSVSEKSVSSYKVVEVGDFIISLRSFQGGIEYSNYLGLCSPAYIILRKKKDLINDFYRHYFKSHVFIQNLNKNLEGIRDGKMVSYKQFSDILIPKPSIKEQQKIASCLSAADDLIAAQTQKIEALQAHKKGLLQQLFPNING